MYLAPKIGDLIKIDWQKQTIFTFKEFVECCKKTIHSTPAFFVCEDDEEAYSIFMLPEATDRLIGALVVVIKTRIYVQANAGAIRTLPQRETREAVRILAERTREAVRILAERRG